MRKTLFVILLLTLAVIRSMAVPARGSIRTYTQPDGSMIRIRVNGDEFNRSVTTEDGCSIILGEDGFYTYAFYDFMGGKHNSGIRIGADNSSQAAAKSRSIPHDLLNANAAAKRRIADDMRSSRSRAMYVRNEASGTERKTATKANVEVPVQKGVIILAQFSDLHFKYGREYFVNMLTGTNYSYNGASGSAIEYFNSQFDGNVRFEFTVSPIVTLPKGYAYYGKNDDQGFDENAPEAIAEACRLASSSVDFSQFDGDGDGEVDNVFVFVAGEDEAEGASEGHIWSHQWYLKDGAGVDMTLAGKRINSYAISTEIMWDSSYKNKVFTSIGTFCHEYSHCLGLFDMYDTDYEGSGGESDALWGSTSIMDHGNYNNCGNTPPNYNAFELECLGLGEREFAEIGSYTLSPISSMKRYLRASSDVEGEYFIFECRDNNGWDKYIGGSGMLIYHVDFAYDNAGYSDSQKRNIRAYDRWYYNEVNANPKHQCLDLIEANPNAQSAASVFWPSGKQTSFSGQTSPSFEFWSGKKSNISLIDIRKSNGSVSFSIAGPLSIEKVEAFQDQVIVQWIMSSSDNDALGWITLIDSKGNRTQSSAAQYAPGQYAYRFTDLQDNTTYTVEVSNQKYGEKKVSTEFKTKPFYSDGYPFIYLNSTERNSDGSFPRGAQIPLVVYNAREAVKVSWSYNAIPMQYDGSEYFTVSSDGTLRAIIDYKDGTRDVIYKKISVK